MRFGTRQPWQNSAAIFLKEIETMLLNVGPFFASRFQGHWNSTVVPPRMSTPDP